MTRNRTYSKEFKFKVAIEMIRGDLTIAEVVNKYQVPKSVASKWKKQLLDNGSTIFDGKKLSSSNSLRDNIEVENLYSTIGRLKVENNFLHSVSAKLKL